jgi:hypothetical protein
MTLLRRALSTTGAKVLLFTGLLILAFQAWVLLEAPAKIDEGLAATANQRGQVAAEVELDFPPERFHILHLQDYGRIRRTAGNVVEMRGLTMEDARTLSRTFWVRAIRPASDDS